MRDGLADMVIRLNGAYTVSGLTLPVSRSKATDRSLGFAILVNTMFLS